jgi:hypothetical protein
VPNAGLADRDRPHPGDQRPLGQIAVANDGRPTFGPASALVSLQVFLNFMLDGGLEHLAGACGNELFQRALGLNFCWPL